MPPRTTQQSNRPRVSDRTMVGTSRQPLRLTGAASAQRLHSLNETKSLESIAARASLHQFTVAAATKGLDVRDPPPLRGVAEVFSLDIPFYRTRAWTPAKTASNSKARAPLGAPRLPLPVRVKSCLFPCRLTVRTPTETIPDTQKPAVLLKSASSHPTFSTLRNR